jgi:hypothetical protein
VGSRSKIAKEKLAYIAGFLDGDGSLMLQLKKRKDGIFKFRFMATICFYQDTRHEKDLYWIRKVLKIGYVSRRRDGMTELRINGFKQVREILTKLASFIRFKRLQARALIKACEILSTTKFKMLNKRKLLKLVGYVLVIHKENYVTKTKKTREEFLQILGLTP